MTDFQAIMADFAVRQAERAAQAQSEIQRLKAAIIAPLRNAEIARVEIRFDGCGDSGAVEECVFSNAGGASVPCPEVTIDCAGEGDDQSLNSSLEQLTYLALERHHPGWEINDGACGELVIDVATPNFVLDCQLRYTATDDQASLGEVRWLIAIITPYRRFGNGEGWWTITSRSTNGLTSQRRSLLIRGTGPFGTMPKAYSCSKRCSGLLSSTPTAVLCPFAL